MVAPADDCAPTITDSDPGDVLNKMQLLLNIVECHGSQLHREFGVRKQETESGGGASLIRARDPNILWQASVNYPGPLHPRPTLVSLKPLASSQKLWLTKE